MFAFFHQNRRLRTRRLPREDTEAALRQSLLGARQVRDTGRAAALGRRAALGQRFNDLLQ